MSIEYVDKFCIVAEEERFQAKQTWWAKCAFQTCSSAAESIRRYSSINVIWCNLISKSNFLPSHTVYLQNRLFIFQFTCYQKSKYTSFSIALHSNLIWEVWEYFKFTFGAAQTLTYSASLDILPQKMRSKYFSPLMCSN